LDYLDIANLDSGAYWFVSFHKKNGGSVSNQAYSGYIPFIGHAFRFFDRYDCIPVQNCVTIAIPFVEIIALDDSSLAQASVMAGRNGPHTEESFGFFSQVILEVKLGGFLIETVGGSL
jgi:hypothetical protein